MDTSFTPQQLNDFNKPTMAGHLAIEITEIQPNALKAKMPVTEKSQQPAGLLHGGASVAFAETLGSIASWLSTENPFEKHIVGLEINASHLKSAKVGEFVFGTCTPLKLGKTVHVWDIKISNEKEEMVCNSRLTVMVLEKK